MRRVKKLVECKSIGVHLTESTARKVDELVKSLPRDCKYHRKTIVPQVEEVKECWDISMISTETMDRDCEIILAKGIDIEDYSRNPIVCFNHDHDMPIGRSQWIKKVSGGIKAKTLYTDATETSRAVWQMVKEGVLKGKSIGFLPTSIRSATDDEISKNPSWKNANAVIESGILLEYSVVSVPSNASAIVEAISKGLVDKGVMRQLGLVQKERLLTPEYIAKFIAEEFKRCAAELTPEKIRAAKLSKYGI